MTDMDGVPRTEFNMLIKNLNGNLSRLDSSIVKMDTENTTSHDKLHERIDEVLKAVNDQAKSSMSKGTATIIAVLSSVAVGSLMFALSRVRW